MPLGRGQFHPEQNKPNRYRIVDIPIFYLPSALTRRLGVPPCSALVSSESHPYDNEPDSNWDLNEYKPQIRQVPIRLYPVPDRYRRG